MTKPTSIALVSALIIVALSSWSFTSKNRQPTERLRVLAAADLSQGQPKPATPSLVAVSTDLERHPDTLPPTPTAAKFVPHAVRDFFPSITQRVENWRAFNPETLTVAPFPDMPVTFTRVSIKEDSSLTGGHYTTWVGRSPDMSGASLVTVGTDSGFDAILVVPGNGEVNFHISGAGDDPREVSMSAVSSADLGCGIGSVPSRPNLTPHTAAVYSANYANAALNVRMPAEAIVVADGVPTVDLLYVFDASSMIDFLKTKTSGDPVVFLDGQLKAVTESMNLFLSQSGITTFKFKYLGVLQAPDYSRTGALQDDLNAMAPIGKIGSWITQSRYDYGADEVCLLVATSKDYGGIANMNPQQPPTKDSASFVATCGGGWGLVSNTVSAEIVAHEIGHTLGCNHDRITANTFKDGKYCYGWMTTATATTGSYSFTSTLGTLMSYANGRIPYYSNPNLSVEIYQDIYNPQPPPSTGGPAPKVNEFGFFTIGTLTTDENPQYNAKVMADNGPIASLLADSISVPIITQQPFTTAAVVAGQDLSLSVVAQGGGLNYQWSRDGTKIPNATAAILTKVSMNSADAGSYTVAVSNKAGAVTSSPSSVTVSTATTPVNPPSTPVSGGSSSSGGGGGGSVEGWFALTLFVLFTVRGMSRTKND